jgi:YaiO family outer membrane protein
MTKNKKWTQSTPSVFEAFGTLKTTQNLPKPYPKIVILMLVLMAASNLFAQTDSLRNRIGVGVELEKHPYFNGSAIGIEYARKSRGWQNVWLVKGQQVARFGRETRLLQTEWYPKLSEKRYACLGLSVSDGGIFPKYHAAAHLMQNLRGGVEIEGGARYIVVNSAEKAWVLIGGASKYWKNYLFNAKAYFATGANLKGQTFTASARRYAHDEVSFLWLQMGVSRSAQIESINPFMFNDVRLNTRWLQMGVQQQLTKKWSVRSSLNIEQFNVLNRAYQNRILGSLQVNRLF